MNYNAETYICYGKKENRANRRGGQSTPCDKRRDVSPLAFLEHSFDNLDDMGMSLSDIVKLTVGLSSWSRKSTDVLTVNCSKERDCSMFARVAWSSFSSTSVFSSDSFTLATWRSVPSVDLLFSICRGETHSLSLKAFTCVFMP